MLDCETGLRFFVHRWNVIKANGVNPSRRGSHPKRPRKPNHVVNGVAELMPEGLAVSDILTIAVLLVAAYVHGAAGFGFPLVATPLLVLSMDLRGAILLTLLPTIAINLVSIIAETRWREALRRFWPIPVFTLVGSILGTQILLSVDPEPFRVLLALVLIAFLLLDRRRGSGPEHRLPGWGLALLGLGMGLMAGVVNIFSPVVVAFALYTRMSPALMVATFNLSFITSKTGQLMSFAAGDALDPSVIRLALIALPFVLLALWAGIRLRRRLDQDAYRVWLRRGLWIVVAALIVQAFLGGTGIG